MSSTQTKTTIDRRAEQLNPTSPQYYQNRGYSPQDAATLTTLTQQRHRIEASHLKQTQKRASD